jgi:hypothetical protein
LSARCASFAGDKVAIALLICSASEAEVNALSCDPARFSRQIRSIAAGTA